MKLFSRVALIAYQCVIACFYRRRRSVRVWIRCLIFEYHGEVEFNLKTAAYKTSCNHPAWCHARPDVYIYPSLRSWPRGHLYVEIALMSCFNLGKTRTPFSSYFANFKSSTAKRVYGLHIAHARPQIIPVEAIHLLAAQRLQLDRKSFHLPRR